MQKHIRSGLAPEICLHFPLVFERKAIDVRFQSKTNEKMQKQGSEPHRSDPVFVFPVWSSNEKTIDASFQPKNQIGNAKTMFGAVWLRTYSLPFHFGFC